MATVATSSSTPKPQHTLGMDNKTLCLIAFGLALTAFIVAIIAAVTRGIELGTGKAGKDGDPGTPGAPGLNGISPNAIPGKDGKDPEISPLLELKFTAQPTSDKIAAPVFDFRLSADGRYISASGSINFTCAGAAGSPCDQNDDALVGTLTVPLQLADKDKTLGFAQFSMVGVDGVIIGSLRIIGGHVWVHNVARIGATTKYLMYVSAVVPVMYDTAIATAQRCSNDKTCLESIPT